MRINKALAVAVTGCALVGAAMLPAAAGPSHAAAKAKPAVGSVHIFKSTLNTHTPSPGTKLVLKGTGTLKRTQYSCVLIVIKGKAYTVGPITTATSSKKGKLTCKATYEPYTAVSLTGGAAHKCPLTKKDKKAHYRCAMAVSNGAMNSTAIQYFTPKK